MTFHPNHPELQRSRQIKGGDVSACCHSSHKFEEGQLASQGGKGVNCKEGLYFIEKTSCFAPILKTHSHNKTALGNPRAAFGKRGREVECSRFLIGQTCRGSRGFESLRFHFLEKDSNSSPKEKAK